jgi:putative ABC transport system permease protein
MPDWRRLIRARLGSLGLDPRVESDIVDELATDLEERYRELVERGRSPEDAAIEIEATHLSSGALTEAIGTTIGKAAAPRPVLGAEREGRHRSDLLLDFRYAFRSALKAPVLTAVVLLTLALGTGANIAIFSVVNALLLRPLPFDRPDQLVTFWGTAPEKGLPVVNYPEALYSLYRKRLAGAERVSIYSAGGSTLTGVGEAARMSTAWVSADFFGLLGVTPIAGRSFLPEEETPGKGNVALLGYGLWHRRFGGDRAVLGRSITIDGNPLTVVGIMPPGFDFPDRAELWTPLEIHSESLNCWCYVAIGRIRPDRTEANLAREVDALNDAFWAEREPGKPRPPRVPGAPPGTIVTSLTKYLAGDIRTPVLVLLGAVGMVLLIACANLANLALARAIGRQREFAVRAALGASPRRIARQLFTEQQVLSLGGTANGLGAALLGIGAVTRAQVEAGGPLTSIPFDLRVLAFTLVLALGAGFGFGLLPALRGSRVELGVALKEGSRGTGDVKNRRLNDGFVVVQLALSLVLLIGAGLLLRSFGRLLAVDLGFRAEKVLIGTVGLPWGVYREPEIRVFAERLLDRVSTMPGVEAAAIVSTAPFGSGNNQQEVYVEGREVKPDEPIPVASVRGVSAGYFDAVGTRLLAGRPFGPADRDSAERVAIIDQTLARRYWADRSPLGARLSLGEGQGKKPTWLTIVGVAAPIHHGQVYTPADHYVYLPLAQAPRLQFDLVLRAVDNPVGLIGSARRVVEELDPNVPLYDAHPLAVAVDRSLAARRLTNLLLTAFAVGAVLLAAIGIYGVMTRSVAARTKEFGVRQALGASAIEVRRLVLKQAGRLVLIGTGIGLIGAGLITRLLRGLLFDVDSLDPLTFALASVLLGGAALAASYLPARRATAGDPLEALRSE